MRIEKNINPFQKIGLLSTRVKITSLIMIRKGDNCRI